MMETTPEPVQQTEGVAAPTIAEETPTFAAEYLVALLSARIEARKKSEGEPQDVAVEVQRTTER